MVLNPGFEVGDPPTSWTDIGFIQTISRQSGGHSGSYCLKVTFAADAGSYGGYQEINVTAGVTYDFSCFVKQGTSTAYRVWIQSSPGMATVFNETDTAGADWTEVGSSFTVGAGITKLYIYCLLNTTSGNILFDDVNLSAYSNNWISL